VNKVYWVSLRPLESGYVVKVDAMSGVHRTAEPTLQGALTLAARALGYRGVIRFDDEPQTSGTVNAPYIPRANERLAEVPAHMSRAEFAVDLARAMCPHLVPDYTPPGVPFDAEEPPLRAGTAKPGDKL